MNLVREAPLLLFDRDISQNFLFETLFSSKKLFSAENGKSLNQLVFMGFLGKRTFTPMKKAEIF